MAEPETEMETSYEGGPAADDVEMGGDAGDAEDTGATELADIEPDVPEMITFLDYLKSPIVELVVGTGDDEAILSAHQAMLVKAPWFAEKCAQFPTDGPRRIDLVTEDLTAVGSVLEYLYNGEYFPRRVDSSRKDSALETDPAVPVPDNAGVALLRHARVYTLADKFSIPALKSLAHAKIHRTESTAKGEIAYARFVYKETSKEDNTIRKPVAAFWAMRSHVLRHEAEDEFRSMCLEFPQFGFDVLTLVLDTREKQKESAGDRGTPVVPGSRKRARVSQA